MVRLLLPSLIAFASISRFALVVKAGVVEDLFRMEFMTGRDGVTAFVAEPRALALPDDLEGEAWNDTLDEEDDFTEDADMAAVEPPIVECIGRAPKFFIYPGGDSRENSTWILLTFGAIKEVDAEGKQVDGRSMVSLASAPVEWDQSNEIVSGASAIVTTMSLKLEYGGSLEEQCADNRRLQGTGNGEEHGTGLGGDNGNDADSFGVSDSFDYSSNPAARGNSANGSGQNSDISDHSEIMTLGSSSSPVSITIKTFVFESDAIIDYGNFSIEVQRGHMKFNIESEGWPFCSESNFLEISLDIKSKGSRGPSMSDTKEAEGSKPRGKEFRADAGGQEAVMALPMVALVDAVMQDLEVDMGKSGDKTEILFRFPYFRDTLIYDPSVGFGVEELAAEPPVILGSEESTSDEVDNGIITTPEAKVTSERTTPQEDDDDSSTTVADEEAMRVTPMDKSRSPTVVISGIVKVSVQDADTFCANQIALYGIAKVLAKQTARPSSDIKVSCEDDSRRLKEEGNANRLQESLDLSYMINIHSNSSNPDSISASSPIVLKVIEALTSLNVPILQSFVQSEFESLGIDVEIIVEEILEPSAVTAATRQSPMTTTESPFHAGSAYGDIDLSARHTLRSSVFVAMLVDTTSKLFIFQ